MTDDATKRAIKILDTKYEQADLPKIVQEKCTHLTNKEKLALLKLLTEFQDLFYGTLGDWKTSPVHSQLKEGAQPYNGKAYLVPKIHRDVPKKEVERSKKLGVLKREPDSEYGSPSFIIPKPGSSRVRFLTDFREINKRLVRKPWPLPKISTILQELEGFKWATALDLNMGYYTIRLDPEPSKICTIILSWGKYVYLRLPMRIAGSPDIFSKENISSNG